jgi:ribosomal protein S3AE
MKKIFVYLVLVFGLSFQSYSQNVDAIINQFAKNENVYKIRIGTFGMFFVKNIGAIFIKEKDVLPILKSIKSLGIFILDDESDEKTKNEIKQKLSKLKDDHEYTTFLQVKDGDDNVRMMVRKDKNIIRELLLIVDDAEDTVVIRVKGKLKESDLAEIIVKYNERKNL